MTSESGNPNVAMSWWHEPALPVGTKLYTTPPQPIKPLTEEMVKAADRLGLGYTERGYFNDGWCEAESAHGFYAPSELKENE